MGNVFKFPKIKTNKVDKDTIELLCRVLRVSEKYFDAILRLPKVTETEIGRDMADLVAVIDDVVKMALGEAR